MSPRTMVETGTGTTPTVQERLEAFEITEKDSTTRHVRFANRTKIYLIPALSDYSDQEFAAVWMGDDESKATQAGLLRDIKAMRSDTTESASASEEFCSRGIEHMRSAALLEQRKAVKAAVTNAVLDVQDIQFEADVLDEDEIWRASSSNTQWARENAASLAAADAAYVRLHVRAEVDAYLREQATVAILQNALDVSDSEDSFGSAGKDPQNVNTKPRHHVLSSTRQLSRSRSPPNNSLTHASMKQPRTSVDTFLNQISSRVNAETKLGTSARMTLQPMQSGTALNAATGTITTSR